MYLVQSVHCQQTEYINYNFCIGKVILLKLFVGTCIWILKASCLFQFLIYVIAQYKCLNFQCKLIFIIYQLFSNVFFSCGWKITTLNRFVNILEDQDQFLINYSTRNRLTISCPSWYGFYLKTYYSFAVFIVDFFTYLLSTCLKC